MPGAWTAGWARALAGGALGLAVAGYWGASLEALGGAPLRRGVYDDYVVPNLQALPPGAVLCSAWPSVWGWRYAQRVEHRRPDVQIVAKGPGECARDVVPQQLGRRPVYLTQPPDPDRPRRSQLVLAPAGDLRVVVGRRASLPDGVLLQGSDGRIHVLDRGRRRWIASVAVFERRGFRWEQVRLTPDDVLDDIPEDDALTE
jgi:hypothetical protein